MKINILFSFVLFLAFGVYAQNLPNDLVEIHYDNDNASGVGIPKKDLIIAAKLNDYILAPYVGHNLSAIKIYINNAPVGNTGIVQIYSAGTSTEPGDLLYSSSPVHVDSNAWNTIPLSEPVIIPSSELWIGFEALSSPSKWQSWAGCDSGPNDPDGQYIHYNGAWHLLTTLGPLLTYNWNIRAVIETTTEVKPETLPVHFSLQQNYPNPFNPATTITYSLAKKVHVKLTIYNSIGNKVATILNEYKPSGSYSVQFNGSNLPSGIYLYRLETDNYIAAKKLILLK